MEMNLKAELVAYHRLSPSILENYVSNTELDNKLKDYVKEVENPEAPLIYGRQKQEDGTIQWSPVSMSKGVLFYGISNKEIFDTEDDVEALNSLLLTDNEALIEVSSLTPGYIWFCSSREIESILFLGPWPYEQPYEAQEGTIEVTKASAEGI